MKPSLAKSTNLGIGNINYTVIFIMLILLIGLINIYYPFITTNPLVAIRNRLAEITRQTQPTQHEIAAARAEAQRTIGEIEEAALIRVNNQLA